MPTKKNVYADKILKASFERVHSRIDEGETEMRKVKVTLWGDPEKNIVGFLQSYAQFVTEMKMYMKIITIIGTSVTVALVGAIVKMWFMQ